jgi:hypothetical protein
MGPGRIEFEKQIFSGVPQASEILALPSSVRRALFEVGIPKYFFYRDYSADPALAVLALEGRSPFVRFGADRGGMIGVDSASGNVLHVANNVLKKITFVNMTIDKFSDTVRILTDRFPYGASLDGVDGIAEAADEMREIIRSTDALAIVRGSYWPDFADEIDGQLYGVDEILYWYQHKMSLRPLIDETGLGQREVDESDDRLF